MFLVPRARLITKRKFYYAIGHERVISFGVLLSRATKYLVARVGVGK